MSQVEEKLYIIGATNMYNLPKGEAHIAHESTMVPVSGSTRVKAAILRAYEIERGIVHVTMDTPDGPVVFHVAASDAVTEALVDAVGKELKIIWDRGAKEKALLGVVAQMEQQIQGNGELLDEYRGQLGQLQKTVIAQNRLIHGFENMTVLQFIVYRILKRKDAHGKNHS